MMQAIVTTVRKHPERYEEKARTLAERLGIPFVERRNLSEEKLCAMHGAEHILTVKEGKITLTTEVGALFFHPNMAHLRIKTLRCGGRDNMAEAMGLTRGMRVFDATLGLAADAIVASFLVGEEGAVVGMEASPLLHAVVADGLQHYKEDRPYILEAMRRIEARAGNSLDFLKAQAENSFDVVYFDPMFRHPLTDSAALSPLRTVASHAPVTEELLAEAKRVARQRVVFKENARSEEFSRLGFSERAGGKYSPIQYGVWRKS